MPRSNAHPVSKPSPLSRVRHHPYAQPANNVTGRNPRIHESTIVPFKDIEIGRFYNCAISFTPILPGGRVPGMMPKHRVLVTRIESQANEHSVEVFYMTTFGGRTPALFHDTQSENRHMYLPFEPEQLAGRVSLSSNPPVIRGWLNFARPVLVTYSDDLPGPRKLRHAPESAGVRIPLRHGPIVIGGWGLQYAKEMKVAWQDTIDTPTSGSSRAWATRAQRLFEIFSGRKLAVEGMATSVAGEERVGEEEEDEEEWGGITGVGFSFSFVGRVLSFADIRQLLDGNDEHDTEDAVDPFTLREIERSLDTPGAATPKRASRSPLPTPTTIGRHRLPFPATPLFRSRNVRVFPQTPPLTCPRPTRSLQHDEIGHVGEPSTAILASEWDIGPPGLVHKPDAQRNTNPVYDEYTATAVFWDIEDGEEDEIEDPPADMYSKVICGRPRLRLCDLE